MSGKTFSAIMLSLLVISTLTLAFRIQIVKADDGIIYINADGSISPSTAPIYSADNITYTLTGNISDSIVVERDNIVLDGAGFTIQGDGTGNGIDLSNRSGVTIENTNIEDFTVGAYLENSSNNTISGDNITENDEAGIVLGSSSNNSISNNNARANSEYGIWLGSSSNNSISNNNATANSQFGIGLGSSSNNSISGNNVANNWVGIGLLSSSNNNSVTGNNVGANSGYGIWLYSSSNNNSVSENNITENNCDGIGLVSSSNNNSVSGNNITENNYSGYSGIWLDSSSNNSFSSNNIANSYYGIFLDSTSSNNNFYHNNFVDNTQQVYGNNLMNIWDNGYPSGGNYWSDYTGTDLFSGPYQNIPGSDGIGETPYIIDANNTDNYPLTNPYSTNMLSITISPASSTWDTGQSLLFTSEVQGGILPYTYQWYLNASAVQDATYSNWTFMPTSAGPYNVTTLLEVTDSVGAQATSNTATVAVLTHDVAVANVASSEIVVGQNLSASINVTVANQGNFTETFNVTAYANATIIASENVTLPAGNSTTVTFKWNTVGFAYGNYTLSAYALPVPSETNTGDNTFTDGTVLVTIPGDLNGDFRVSLADLLILANAYKSTPADSNWNPNADIDGNGVVGLTDLTIMAYYYGQHYP